MKRVGIGIGLFLIGLIGLVTITGDEASKQPLGSTPTASFSESQAPAAEAVETKVEQAVTPPPEPVPVQEEVVAPPSTTNYYTNVDGNTVQSPTASIDGSIPAGASAQCNDGTFSFSQNRRGTCSGHGGVNRWL